MTMYRLRAADGTLRAITAGRVVVAEPELRFQSPGTSGWVTVDSAVLAEVARVERRVNEADGRVRWVDEAEANAAAGAARPEQQPDERRDDSTTVPAVPARTVVSAPPPSAPPLAAVSARDVRCPRCGEEDELSGRRSDGQILLTCHTCGYDGPRVAQRLCRTCGGHDVVERPKALVERSRGTQLSVVGYTTAALCRSCDADDLAAALARGGAILPKELPTVDPQTLREMGRRPDASPKARSERRRRPPPGRHRAVAGDERPVRRVGRVRTPAPRDCRPGFLSCRSSLPR